MADGTHASPAKRGADQALDRRLLQLAPEDNVAVARTTLAAGETILVGGEGVVLAQAVPTGHKIASLPIAAGDKVTKYGAPIGSATGEIHPGDYVHTHNVKSDYLPTYTYDHRAPA